MPTINGVNYTPFEAGKNAKELGIDLSRKFIVVKNFSGKNYFQNGDILNFDSKSVEDHSLAYFKCEDKDVESRTTNRLMYWSELAYYDEPKPLTNTIITNIKDEAQHKRVQEKLFEMGIESPWGKNRFMDCHSGYTDIIIDDRFGDIRFFNCDSNNKFVNREYTHITADEFLGEDKQCMVLEKDTPRQEYIDLPKDYLDIKVNILPEVPKEFWSTGISERANQLIKDLREYKYNTPTDTPIVKGNKIMSNIVSFFNDLTVSAEDKDLRKAGLKDGELNWTSAARQVVLNLEAKDRGYKSIDELASKVGDSSFGALELDSLFTKFSSKLLETAKKFNKREEKK